MFDRVKLVDAVRNEKVTTRVGPFSTSVGRRGLDLSVGQFEVARSNTFLNDINAQVRRSGGYARNNQYQAIIYLPTGANESMRSAISSVPSNRVEGFEDIRRVNDIDGLIGSGIEDGISAAGEAFSSSGAFGKKLSDFLGWTGRDAGSIQHISMNCSATELPGLNITTTDPVRYGPVRKMPLKPFYVGEIPLTFYVSQEFFEKRFFDDWMRLIFNEKDYTMNYYDDYVAQMEIRVFTRDSYYNRPSVDQFAIMHRVFLQECYPLAIDPIPLSYDQSSDVMSINVRMAYRRWITVASDAERTNYRTSTESRNIEGVNF